MEQGLAAQSAGQGMGMGMGGQGSPEQMIQQVVQMLMEGVDPEQLVQQGVPIEIIQAAIEIIMAQEQQAQNNATPAATQGGLAATSAGM